MIRGKGKLTKVAGHCFVDEFTSACEKLPDGNDYLFVISDTGKNRSLPALTYLFSVVLSYIANSLPDKPTTIALYKYFEDMFAPIHTSKINGETFEYVELKSERSADINDVTEKIVEYALKEWGIEVPRQEDMKDPAMRELHSQAYLNQEVDWSNYFSSRSMIIGNGGRIKKTERI